MAKHSHVHNQPWPHIHYNSFSHHDLSPTKNMHTVCICSFSQPYSRHQAQRMCQVPHYSGCSAGKTILLVMLDLLSPQLIYAVTYKNGIINATKLRAIRHLRSVSPAWVLDSSINFFWISFAACETWKVV